LGERRGIFELLRAGVLRPALVEDDGPQAFAALQLWAALGSGVLGLYPAVSVVGSVARSSGAGDVRGHRAAGQPVGTAAARGVAQDAFARGIVRNARWPRSVVCHAFAAFLDVVGTEAIEGRESIAPRVVIRLRAV